MIRINIKKNNNDFQKTFIIIPEICSNHIEELSDCLNQVDKISKEYLPNFRILKMNIFVDAQNITEFNDIKESFNHLISNINEYPKLYIAQPPANQKKIAIEISAIILPVSEYSYEFFNKGYGSFYKLKMGNDIEIYGSIYDNDSTKTNVYLQSSNCFKFVQDVLEINNLDFKNIVRQWAYIGNLNDFNILDNSEMENYQMFNLARTEYYKNCNWENGYPSATAIGANIDGCSIEFIATNEIQDKLIIPLHNPRQFDAHKYSEKFQSIVSTKIESNIPTKMKNTPKFERGKVVITNDSMDIYISGTAAIIGEDSIANDIQQQTKITLDNIAQLSSKSNLYEHGIDIESELPQFSSVRAYIKHSKDVGTVEEMCRNFFGDIPILCVIADVCRKELLVEIEAVMSCEIKFFGCDITYCV
jgi:enamine deaminase RidA (YjgF/YER057c/UK114 family)